MSISYVIEKEQSIGTSRKSIFVILRNDTPTVAYRRLEVPLVPLGEEANAYLSAHYTLQQAWDAGATITVQAGWVTEQKPLVTYYQSIILSLYSDVDNAGATLVQMLTNAANIVATNATQAAKFSAYRTRMGLDGTIASLTTAQQRNLLALGLEWAAAGLAVALSKNGS